MPKLRKVVVDETRRRRISPTDDVFVESISKVVQGLPANTNDLYRFGRTARDFMEKHPDVLAQFKTYYEGL